ncbi:TPA: hypothetical protein TXJ06_000345 [Streptococcus suis]|nr:hypothetical protein [Streptococcus suis]
MKRFVKYIFKPENIISISFIVFLSFTYLSMEEIKNPAIDTLKSVDGRKILTVLVASLFIAGMSAFFVVDLLKYVFKNDDDIHFDVIYIIFTALLGFGLLRVLTEEQFSLISTFITFPLFIAFPKVLKKVVKNRSIKRENKEKDDSKYS